MAWLLALFLLIATNAAAQTSAELRARYGEPRVIWLEDGRPVFESYLVRPNILMKVIYTAKGQPCEVRINPEKPSGEPTLKTEYTPAGDLMRTATVIEIINELAPVEQRGKKIGDGSMNGGDDEMKLHHPGCYGVYDALYENVTISSGTWCWGGTIWVVIHWGETRCEGQSTTVERDKSKGEIKMSGPAGTLTIKKKS